MSPNRTDVRSPAMAGSWYPGDASELRSRVAAFLRRARAVELPGRLLALVSPHAGLSYSGPTAAHAYAQLRGTAWRRVVLIGPLHRPIGGREVGWLNAPEEASYRTPLGDVAVDRAYLDRLAAHVAVTPVAGDQEHSLEVQLPFLQAVLDDFLLVPLMTGARVGDPGTVERLDDLAAALAAHHDEDTVLVASTDLAHLHDHETVIRVDRQLVDLVAALDFDGIRAALSAETAQACGAAGLVVVLEAARRLGARGATILDYATSGDVTGEKRPGVFTVGYLAAAIHG